MTSQRRIREEARRRGIVLPEERRAAEILKNELFDRQLGPFDVDLPDGRVICSCGRRAGKTTLVAVKLLCEALLHPNSLCLYLCFSFQDAKDNVWEMLLGYLRKVDPQNPELLPSDLLKKEPSETLAEVHLTNGSVIRLGGVATRKEARKVVGKKYRLVVMDELQDWQEEIIGQTFTKLEPAMIDLHGSVWMIGTPGMVRAGFYFDAWSGRVKGWEKFFWDMRENPHMAAQFEQYLRRACEERGLDPASPAIRRELFGEWVEDDEGKAYRFTDDNIYDGDLPQNDEKGRPYVWRYVLGVDLGSVDSTALVVVAYATTHPDTREVYSWKAPGKTFTEVGEKIKKLYDQYRLQCVVVDPAAGGKQFEEELKTRWGIVSESAKTKLAGGSDKRVGRGWLNADLRTNLFKVRRESTLLDEWRKLTVDKRGEEDPAAENHLSDACLYAYRKVRFFRPKKDEPLPPHPMLDMDDWEARHIARLEERVVERKLQERKRLSSLYGPRKGRLTAGKFY